MFTDWSLAEGVRDIAEYFFLRGALWGFVLGNILHLLIIPMIKPKSKR